MSGFLDDIQEESYSDALAFGNLKAKPRDELERFVSTGYTAAIHVSSCACGTITRHLGGIFHREEGTKGSVRCLNILADGRTPQVPLIPTDKPVTYLGSKTKVCAYCVGAHGFSLNPDDEARSIA
jgi:hypothetical protein